MVISDNISSDQVNKMINDLKEEEVKSLIEVYGDCVSTEDDVLIGDDDLSIEEIKTALKGLPSDIINEMMESLKEIRDTK